MLQDALRGSEDSFATCQTMDLVTPVPSHIILPCNAELLIACWLLCAVIRVIQKRG